MLRKEPKFCRCWEKHDAKQHSHHVNEDGAAGGDQHHLAVDLIVTVDDPLDG